MLRGEASWITPAVVAITYLAIVAFRLHALMNVWLLTALLASALRPGFGVILTALTLVPPEIDIVGGLPTGFLLMSAAATGELSQVVIRGRSIRLDWAIGALLAFSLITLVSLLWVMTRPPAAPEAVHDWAILMAGVLACLIVASNARYAETVPEVVFALGVVVAVIAALAVVVPGPFEGAPFGWLVRQGDFGRALGSTHGANILGLIAAMSFAYFTLRAIGDRQSLPRINAALMAIVCLPALYYTFSRSAALGVGIAVVFGLLLMRRRIAVLVTVFLVAGAILFGPTLFASRLDTSSGVTGGHLDPRVAEAQTVSDRLRVQAWLAGMRMAIDRPITGVGFGRYSVVRERYGGPVQLNTPHSDYVRFFAETGVPGGVAFLVFLAGLAWSVRTTRDPGRASLAAAILTFCVATQFNAQLYYLEAALPFWVAVGAAIRLGRSDDEETAGVGPPVASSELRGWLSEPRPAP
jgi:O-antigen ligase